MNSNYPNSIDNFQTKENEQGSEYDPRETTVQFAEDINKTNEAIVKTQEVLGTNPAGDYETVGEYLDNVNLAANLPTIWIEKPNLEKITDYELGSKFKMSKCSFRVGDENFILPAQKVDVVRADELSLCYIDKNHNYKTAIGSADNLIALVNSDVFIPLFEYYPFDDGEGVFIEDCKYFDVMNIQSLVDTYSGGNFSYSGNNAWRNISSCGNFTGLTPNVYYKITATITTNNANGSLGFDTSSYAPPENEFKGSGTTSLPTTFQFMAWSDTQGEMEIFLFAKGQNQTLNIGEIVFSFDPILSR